MILKDGKRYYPVEFERIISSSGRIVYDREIWKQRCQLLESYGKEVTDCLGAAIVLGGFSALSASVYTCIYAGEFIDYFIEEVLYD